MARSGSFSCASGAPKIAMMPSPMNLSIVPSYLRMTEMRPPKHSFKTIETSSTSIFSERAVNPVTSANTTVTRRRSLSICLPASRIFWARSRGM